MKMFICICLLLQILNAKASFSSKASFMSTSDKMYIVKAWDTWETRKTILHQYQKEEYTASAKRNTGSHKNAGCELRVQICKLRVQIHELRVQIHESRVQIRKLRVQIHELRVQIYELGY